MPYAVQESCISSEWVYRLSEEFACLFACVFVLQKVVQLFVILCKSVHQTL